MDDTIIEIKELSKSFSKKKVLNNLSLFIPKGSVYGLLGRNGEGKTTLLKCIAGLLKPSSGTVSVLSDHPWDFKEQTKEKIGYVPQSDRVYPWLTVRQLINYTASFYQHWNHQIVDKLLKEWRVDEHEKFGILSEGQAQKVSIILSLGHEPELLIFDEPVASLDPAARRQFLKTILGIVSNRECTIFFSTHITSDLERVADHVAVLKDGNIDFCGELGQLKDEVKRLRVVTQHPIPEKYHLNGFIFCESSNNEAIITVRSFKDEIKNQLEQEFKAKVEIEDLNLEEIFLELNRS
ncbi:MAG: ABC transporter ATP-binding protein [Candidatus Omnitrophica bacterium]|nr:ABC transporter ATP-binding protein [Candidatus Omnitrophota bacterium]